MLNKTTSANAPPFQPTYSNPMPCGSVVDCEGRAAAAGWANCLLIAEDRMEHIAQCALSGAKYRPRATALVRSDGVLEEQQVPCPYLHATDMSYATDVGAAGC